MTQKLTFSGFGFKCPSCLAYTTDKLRCACGEHQVCRWCEKAVNEAEASDE